MKKEHTKRQHSDKLAAKRAKARIYAAKHRELVKQDPEKLAQQKTAKHLAWRNMTEEQK